MGAVFGALATQPAFAQGEWDAILTIDPFPSPYMSDWEVDPTIGELLVTNLTNQDTDITIYYTLTRGGQLLLNGVTDPQFIAASQSEVFNSTSMIGGEADWDADFQDLIARTGRIPEGEYEGCVTIVDSGGFVLVERVCASFWLLYPDPPYLVFPFDGDTLLTPDPIFEWLPVQTPALAGFRVGYVLEVAPILPGQLPEVALESNILQHLEPDLMETNYQYSVGALPFEPWQRYAWRVQALDGDGFPVSANDGRSEVWTFVYRGDAVEQTVASVEVSPRSDTLGFVGDSARFMAAAFDPDNIEVFGRRFEWRSADTTIARVDSAGVVMATGVGETAIVAAVADVADSARALTTGGGGGAFITFYDPATETSDMMRFVEGSFEDAAALAERQVRSGAFTLRLPRAAAAMETVACVRVATPVEYYRDDARQAFAVELAASVAAIAEIFDCLGIGEWQPRTPQEPLKLFFVASWATDGVPDAFVAIVPPEFGLLDDTNAEWEYAVFIVNLFRDAGIDPAAVPRQIEEYFGSQAVASRAAGDDHQDQGGSSGWWSLSFHGAMQFDEGSWQSNFLEAIGYDVSLEEKRRIQLEGFFGSAGGTTELKTELKFDSTASRGTTRMHEASITGFLPARALDLEPPLGWLTVDSSRVGVQLKVSDSLEFSGAVPSKRPNKYNPTLNTSLVLTLWVSGSGGGSTELVGTVGVDKWDDQKVVTTLQADAVLPLWIVRLGNPQVVFELGLPAPLGVAKSAKGQGGVGVSAGFGFGKSGGGGPDGLESVGLASLRAKWEPFDAAKADSAWRTGRRQSTTGPPTSTVRDLPEFKAQVEARQEHQAALESLTEWMKERDLNSAPGGGEPEDPARSAKWRAANRKVFEWQSQANSLQAVWEEKWRLYEQALAEWEKQRSEARPPGPTGLQRRNQDCPGAGRRFRNKCLSFSFTLSLQHMSLRSLMRDVVGLLVDEARSR